tara:strand:- start:95 stop:862 length:768 start_codon:yes stop_codon:yes gene_type:complete
MGRPLKIQKRSTGSGNSGAAVNVDIGYPNFGSLTDPVYNAPVQTLDSTQYVGVVGGASSAATSATNPRVLVEVNITLASGSAAGYIIRQKGSHKYLVGDSTSRTALVVGNAYRIITVGNTAWTSYGAPANYAVGTIFTCTVALGSTGTGAVNLVGVCVLSNAASPANGNMSIAYIDDTSSEVYVSKLTNHYLLGWEGGSNYAATSVVADVRALANFFTDEGTMIKSGTTGAANTGSAQSGQQNLLNLALVQNATS